MVRYFRLSPINKALLNAGNSANISSSIWIGGIFSPPAVIINSFILPTFGTKLY